MQHINTTTQNSFNHQTNTRKDWWTPLWRGLIIDPDAKHYKAIGKSIWLYLYLLLFAKRATGNVRKSISTIAEETGIDKRTLQRHLSILRKTGYVTLDRSERVFTLTIRNWKPFGNKSPSSSSYGNKNPSYQFHSAQSRRNAVRQNGNEPRINRSHTLFESYRK